MNSFKDNFTSYSIIYVLFSQFVKVLIQTKRRAEVFHVRDGVVSCTCTIFSLSGFLGLT